MFKRKQRWGDTRATGYHAARDYEEYRDHTEGMGCKIEDRAEKKSPVQSM